MESEATVRRNNIIGLVVAIALVAGGFIYGYTRPHVAPDRTDGAAAVHQPQAETQAAPVAEAPISEAAGGPEQGTEPPKQDAAGVPPVPSVANAVEPEVAERISEDHYINICAEIVVAAQGFKNSGQGNEELIAYIPDLLAEAGVTEQAFEETTDRVSSDPQRAERVAKEILKRVEARTGLKMDIKVLPIMNPDMAVEDQ